jgi:hypothetical protein
MLRKLFGNRMSEVIWDMVSSKKHVICALSLL